MKRRGVIAALAGAAVSAFGARAQVGAMRVVGLLSSRAAEESSDLVDSFRKGLRQLGFVESRDVRIEFRWAGGHYDRLPTLASELVGVPVEALFAAGGSPSALAAKAATSTVPIVFVTSDPVGSGLVASLDRPGGN